MLTNEQNVLLKIAKLRAKQHEFAARNQFKYTWLLQQILNDIEQRKFSIVFKYLISKQHGQA